MRSEGFPFISGGLGWRPCARGVAPEFATVRNRAQPSATVCSEAISVCHWDLSWSVFLTDRQALFSLALCANRSFSSSACGFAAQAQCFGTLCLAIGIWSL